MAISTLGKVIKRGWDWLGVTSLQSERINGLIEVPDLAASLTLNKGDFIRTGTRGAVYLAYRKAIQEAVSRQLEVWGDGRTGTPEASSRMMRPLERDLDRVLEELSDDFPLLGSLVERRAGGQKRLPIDGKTTDIAAGTEAIAVLATPSTFEAPRTNETDPAQPQTPPPPTDQDTAVTGPATSTIPASTSAMFPGHGRSRSPMRYGLGIQFEDNPDNSELGRARRIHRLDQPSPSRLPARTGVPLCGLSHFARRRPCTGPVGRRAGSGTHLHHQVFVPLGPSARSASSTSSLTKMSKLRKGCSLPLRYRRERIFLCLCFVPCND